MLYIVRGFEMPFLNYTNKDFSKVYEDYYNNEQVIYEIVKNLIGRETTLMGFARDGLKEYVWRCIKAHNVDFLKQNFNAFNFNTRYYNIYQSVALLKNMPMFSFNLPLRMEQQRTFNEQFMNYVTGFDFVIDFDGDKITDKNFYTFDGNGLWLEVKVVKHLFDRYGIPYTLKASSNNGFHIVVSDKYLAGGLQEKLQFGKRMIVNIKDLFQLETPDVNIYNFRRIWKVPYTLDIRSGAVALPLTDDEFEELKTNPDVISPDRVLKMNLRNRGMLERPFRYEGFLELCRDLEMEDLKKNIVNLDFEKPIVENANT